MSYYKHTDKKSGDGLALTDWNNLSNAVSGHQGLTLAINSSDKIGIGTTNPAQKLQVNGNAVIGESGETLRIGNIGHTDWAGIAHTSRANGTDYALIQNSNGSTIINSKSNQILYFRQGNVDKMVLKSGNVGIGMSNPSQKLEVSGNIKATQFIGNGSQLTNLNASKLTSGKISIDRLPDGLAIASGGITTITGNAIIGGKAEELKIGHVGHHTWAGVAHLNCSVNGTDYALIQHSSGKTILNSKSDQILYFRQGNADKMVIKGGNVGIGTSSPSHKFHVKADSAVGLFESTKTQAYLRISTSEGLGNRIELANRSGGRAAIWVAGGGDALNVTKAGKVGIGTTSPREKLEVKGHIRLSYSSTKFVNLKYSQSDGQFQLQMDKNSSHHGMANKGYKNIASWNGDNNWDFNSDKRLKKNITKEKNILNRLLQLDVVNYNWVYSADSDRKMTGFIAQEVKPLFPLLVGSNQESNSEDIILTLKYSGFGVLAVGAIKELKAQTDEVIESLKKEINTLKKELKNVLVK